MSFADDDIKQIRQYASRLTEKSKGVEIRTKRILHNANELKQQQYDYQREILLLVFRDSRPILRLYERKMPGRVQTLKDIQQQIKSEMNQPFWTEVSEEENRIFIPFSPGDSIDRFVEELLSDVEYGERPAEPEQEAAPEKNKKESPLWKLYEKTLKAFFDAFLDWLRRT